MMTRGLRPLMIVGWIMAVVAVVFMPGPGGGVGDWTFRIGVIVWLTGLLIEVLRLLRAARHRQHRQQQGGTP